MIIPMIKRRRVCGDCSRDDDSSEFCDICESLVCMDCSDLHSCFEDEEYDRNDDGPLDLDEEDFSQLF